MAKALQHGAAGVALGVATLGPGHGGIARVARMSARALIESGADLELISFLDASKLKLHNHPVSGCRANKLTFAARIHMAALTRQFVLYDSIGLGRGHPVIPGLRRPFATWMHGTEVYENMRADYRAVLARAAMVIANTKYTLDRHQALYGPLRSAKVCWLATEHDEPPVDGQMVSFAGPPSALIVGRIETSEGWKGHSELIACWPAVMAAVPGARLVIAGGGTGVEALRNHVRASGFAGQVDVLGFVEEATMPELFAKAHVFAMPSRQEGFGIAYVEAMRHGLPVIASTHDAGQEVNVDGETGFNVDLDHPTDLTRRLITLLSQTDLARSMGQQGFARWRTHFRYSCFAARFVRIWREFEEDSRTRPPVLANSA